MTAPFAGLSNAEAINLMDAKLLCRYELPQLEQWSAWLHWCLGVAVATVAGACGYLMMKAGENSPAASLAVSAFGASVVLGVTWLIARRYAQRLAHLRALDAGIKQLEAVAQMAPGASAAALIASLDQA